MRLNTTINFHYSAGDLRGLHCGSVMISNYADVRTREGGESEGSLKKQRFKPEEDFLCLSPDAVSQDARENCILPSARRQPISRRCVASRQKQLSVMLGDNIEDV